jgi:UDP-N-acetylglucosamine 2-epimerase
MTIVTVVGERPQFIKIAAVRQKLRQRHKEILVHTGQALRLRNVRHVLRRARAAQARCEPGESDPGHMRPGPAQS